VSERAVRDLVSSLIPFVLSFLLIAPLAACGSSADAWDRVQRSGVLRVGMDASFPPFEYVDGGGNLVGFDVDLAREVAARLGVEAQFVANLPYDGLYDALTAGRVDVVISALYVDPARAAGFAYSTAYFDAGQVLVVADGVEGVEGMEDLGQRMLAVEFGGEGDVVARAWARRLDGLVILPCQDADEALAKVAAGQAEAALVDRLSALARAGGEEALVIVGPLVTEEPYAAAVRRESQRLLQAVDEVLADLGADGTLARLRQRWFGG
jgi:ABC-type amino acid transport substrate-binding protein